MTRPTRQTDPVNVALGKRLRLKRELIGFSQKVLAEHVGISRNRIIQYEAGTQAVPASILFRFAQLFKVDVAYFFSQDNTAHPLNYLASIDPILTRKSIALLQHIDKINDPEVHKTLGAVLERVSELKQK